MLTPRPSRRRRSPRRRRQGERLCGRRSAGPRHADVAFDHRVLDLDCAAHGLDDAAEFDQHAVAGALEHATVVGRDRRIDEFGAQRAKPG